jgi:hypothetical protein
MGGLEYLIGAGLVWLAWNVRPGGRWNPKPPQEKADGRRPADR